VNRNIDGCGTTEKAYGGRPLFRIDALRLDPILGVVTRNQVTKALFCGRQSVPGMIISLGEHMLRNLSPDPRRMTAAKVSNTADQAFEPGPDSRSTRSSASPLTLQPGINCGEHPGIDLDALPSRHFAALPADRLLGPVQPLIVSYVGLSWQPAWHAWISGHFAASRSGPLLRSARLIADPGRGFDLSTEMDDNVLNLLIF